MINDMSEKAFAEALEARRRLGKSHLEFLGASGYVPVARYVENYTQCLLNRMIDVHDDAVFLINNERIASACSISRAMIETFAIALHFGETLFAALSTHVGQSSIDECGKIALRFINSSRLKESEQKKLKKGVFRAEDYQFTEQALQRMTNGLATSEHVMNALRALFADEMKHSGKNESSIELIYDALSEWVHPSQTSVFHQYTPATHAISGSFGAIKFLDAARLHCARAVHLIVKAEEVSLWLGDIAKEIDVREAAVT